MQRFLEWFNGDAAMEPVLKAALAHLWFVTIHPFDDGNGRIARAIADLSLARSEGARSASTVCRRRSARNVANTTESSSGRSVARWTSRPGWNGSSVASRAIEGAQAALSGVIDKARYWEKLRDVPLNERQRLVINKCSKASSKLTTSKGAALTKTSTDTALRDIQQLVERGVLVRNAAGGRSTSYSLAAV